MDLEALEQRYPEMAPIDRTPTLFTINTFGLSLYGNRDFDVESGTHVKTHFVVALMIPIIALGAYRVVDDPYGSGWFFVGKHPLSKMAKFWNLLVLFLVCGLLGGVAVDAYRNDPSRLAANGLAAAKQHVIEGDWRLATDAYLDLYRRYPTRFNVAAHTGESFNHILTNVLPSLETREALVLLNNMLEAKALMDKDMLVQQGTHVAAQLRETDPAAAYRLVVRLRVGNMQEPTLKVLEHEILLDWNQTDPTALQPALLLAQEAEAAGDRSRCRALLVAAEANLGESEGARILAQIYLEEAHYQAAFPLLDRYVTPRLKSAQDAVADYNAAWNSFSEDALNRLRQGRGSQAFYDAWENADEVTQQQMINKHLALKSEKHVGLMLARKRMEEANQIVPLALELGALQLEAAKSEQGEQRIVLLKQAERTFVSLGGFVGEDDFYRLFLGQIKYRLGYEDEGRSILESVLRDGERSDSSLLMVAATAREIGDDSWARVLAEEAYDKAVVKSTAYEAASFRSLVATDGEDRLHWLNLSDPNNPEVVISLNEARGQQAAAAGNTDQARAFFQKALKGYEGTVASAETCNNESLVWYALFRLDGDLKHLEKSVALMDQATRLNPSHPILMQNAASSLMELGLVRLLEKQVDITSMNRSPDILDLYILVHDRVSLHRLRASVRESEPITRAVRLLERAMMMAPKSTDIYDRLDSYYLFLHDGENLARLHEGATLVSPDVSNAIETVNNIVRNGYPETAEAGLMQKIDMLEAALQNQKDTKVLTETWVRCELAGFLARRPSHQPAESSLQKVLALVNTAHATHPSLETAQALRNTHFLLAHQRLLAERPAYAALVQESHGMISPRTLICALLVSDHSLRAALVADPDILAASRLDQFIFATWPDRVSWSGWAALAGTQAEIAETVRRTVGEDPVLAAHLALMTQINPTHPEFVMRAYVAAQGAGKTKGEAVLARAREQQIVVPLL